MVCHALEWGTVFWSEIFPFVNACKNGGLWGHGNDSSSEGIVCGFLDCWVRGSPEWITKRIGVKPSVRLSTRQPQSNKVPVSIPTAPLFQLPQSKDMHLVNSKIGDFKLPLGVNLTYLLASMSMDSAFHSLAPMTKGRQLIYRTIRHGQATQKGNLRWHDTMLFI